MSDGLDDIELPEAAIVRPIRLWTGKQVMSLLIRPNRKCRVLVNFDLKDRNYTSQQSMYHKDGYVVFRNSELLSGNLAKKPLGDGSKKGLFMF
jgi:DNA-directed RNA polymerase III subunit RPC1